MSDNRLNVIENLANVSFFNEEQAELLWSELLGTLTQNNQANLDQKDLRKLLGSRNRFADCTEIHQ